MRTTRRNAAIPDGRGLRVAVVASRFHESVADGLVGGALGALARAGAKTSAITRVPGAFELLPAARLAAKGGQCDAVVCLGAIVRGETPHFDYLAQAVSHGLAALAVSSPVPLTFGVLTTDTLAQARARAGKKDNKGAEAALAAVEMAALARAASRRRGRR